MTEHTDRPGVEETSSAWEPAATPILARPVQEPVDLEALLSEIERDFPKTLARLAE